MSSQTSVNSTLNSSSAIRLLFKVNIEDIPGTPTARHLTLATTFTERYLDREFDWKKDHIHIPANIDHEKGRAFILLDWNARTLPSPEKDGQPSYYKVCSRDGTLYVLRS